MGKNLEFGFLLPFGRNLYFGLGLEPLEDVLVDFGNSAQAGFRQIVDCRDAGIFQTLNLRSGDIRHKGEVPPLGEEFLRVFRPSAEKRTVREIGRTLRRPALMEIQERRFEGCVIGGIVLNPERHDLVITEDNGNPLGGNALFLFQHFRITAELDCKVGLHLLGEFGVPGLVIKIAELRFAGHLDEKIRQPPEISQLKIRLSNDINTRLHGLPRALLHHFGRSTLNENYLFAFGPQFFKERGFVVISLLLKRFEHCIFGVHKAQNRLILKEPSIHMGGER